ncbi:hypothetical protein [Sphingomonas sp. SUN039]|uniref:hypothetical protein n=1 Tax=Sphingomonas sp. SUN039 TaxID=2937787 RepID=UPI0021643C43|nr:hypothetical protein [Sphingomonas sp. SUN039]UVO55690.1 hypothetical protein M0209_16805 [Sphingomonas sp. SUN039]
MHNRPAPDLYTLLPDHFRNRDADQGRPLQALMELLAGELALVERDIDQLYDNWFIETCEQWVIPYIADLVGARALRSFGDGEAGLRAYVANTLGYRQAKGTVAVIEQIARDATGWPIVAVEFFQKLATSQHVNHIRPDAPAFASVRDAETARLAHRPFDPLCHAPGVGTASSWTGRYNIPHIGLLAWRLDAYPLGFVFDAPAGYVGGPLARATALGPGLLTFDRIGRDRPLHNPPKADVSIAARVTERVVPAPLDRRRIYRSLEALKDGSADSSIWFDDEPVLRVRLDGQTVPPEKLCCCALETWVDGGGQTQWRRPDNPGEVCFDPELGRLSLHSSDEGKKLETVHAYGGAFDIGGGPYDRTASVDGWAQDFFVAGEPLPWRVAVSLRATELTADHVYDVTVHPTLAAAIKEWNQQATSGSRGIITILDNGSYTDNLHTPTRIIQIPGNARLAIVAAASPVSSTLDAPAASGTWPHLASDLAVQGSVAGGSETPGTLVLDGLLIEGSVRVKDGDLGRLVLRNCTVGAALAGLTGNVRVEANNKGLALDLGACCVGALKLGAAAGGLMIADSIVGAGTDLSVDPAALPLLVDGAETDADIQRSTVFGRCETRSIEAGNSLFLGVARAAQRQRGCVRFCYAPPGSRLARRFRCQPELALEAAQQAAAPLTAAEQQDIARLQRPIFSSVRWGDAAFARLALTCPETIRSGGDDGAEMGAGFALGEPFRRSNLADVIDEYLPFGLTAAAIYTD